MIRIGILLIIFSLLSCGYQMVGFSGPSGEKKKEAVFYYINAVNNRSADQTITSDVKQLVTQFFSDYGALRPKQSASYILTVALEEYSVGSATVSSSRDAVTLNLVAGYSFDISNASGKNVYNRRISRTQSFSTSESVDEYNRNMEEAFINITEDILSEFKNDFEISLR